MDNETIIKWADELSASTKDNIKLAKKIEQILANKTDIKSLGSISFYNLEDLKKVTNALGVNIEKCIENHNSILYKAFYKELIFYCKVQKGV